MYWIESVRNERVKMWKSLHTRKGRKKEEKFLIEGFHLVEEAFKASIQVDVLIKRESVEVPHSWIERAKEVVQVSQQVMNEISETKTPQGIIAICKLPQQVDFDHLDGRFLLIDRVQDPGNIGTIIRTADCVGMDGVILGDGCADLFNGKVIRSSQGSIFHLPIIKGDIISWIDTFKKASIPVFGSALEHATPYHHIQPPAQYALVMGNEGEGIAKNILEKTDQNLYIPIYGKAESLNVAIATGILLYHFKLGATT